MDELSKRPLKLPKEWIERIFTHLDKIYHGNWKSSFHSEKEYELSIIVWQSGLCDLTVNEIKTALLRCQEFHDRRIKNWCEFHKFAKGHAFEVTARPNKPIISDKKIAEEHLSSIRKKLGRFHELNKRQNPLPSDY